MANAVLDANYWREQFSKSNAECIRLRDENTKLRSSVDSLTKENTSVRNNSYGLLAETIRLRRMMGIMEEDAQSLKEKLGEQILRADKAERGILKLKKWMEINGVKGGIK